MGWVRTRWDGKAGIDWRGCWGRMRKIEDSFDLGDGKRLEVTAVDWLRFVPADLSYLGSHVDASV